MSVDKTKQGLLFPGDAAHKQALQAAGAEHFVKIDGKTRTWRDAVRLVRPGDTIYIWVMVNAPTKRGQDELPPSAQPREFMREIMARGGLLIEVFSGRTSAKKADAEGIIRDAVTALKSKGRKRMPAGYRSKGRHAVAWTDEQLLQAKRAWFSPMYATNEIAEAHMPSVEIGGKVVKFRAVRAWRMWGVSGRPFPTKRSKQ